MYSLVWSDEEQAALHGLLPETQLIYLLGIRSNMDCLTGLVGLKKEISYQYFAQLICVSPNPGISKERSGLPSKAKIRRALNSLIKAGLIKKIKNNNKLLFKCILAHKNEDIQAPQKHQKNSKNMHPNNANNMLSRHA